MLPAAKFFQLRAGAIFFQTAEVVDENNSVQMIDLMLKADGEEPFGFDFDGLPCHGLRLDDYLIGALDVFVEAFER